jgi:hypothetical protein
MILLFLSVASNTKEKTLNHFRFTLVLLGANGIVGLFASVNGMSIETFTKLMHELLWLDYDKSFGFMKFV